MLVDICMLAPMFFFSLTLYHIVRMPPSWFSYVITGLSHYNEYQTYFVRLHIATITYKCLRPAMLLRVPIY